MRWLPLIGEQPMSFSEMGEFAARILPRREVRARQHSVACVATFHVPCRPSAKFCAEIHVISEGDIKPQMVVASRRSGLIIKCVNYCPRGAIGLRHVPCNPNH